ncbi:DUF3788 family protein [Raineyella sp. LH-20]|uniref:DUF3788 family protein n=1 Tax=Raineyella sp. LH-20 TaxID=3081204 RepID=UPI0029536333|nr:DUF3788 family protein [Raineyella sp. LH-20]WOP19128.1 DUF3788 family protein [Raineyella sp. LH-20]
MDNAFVDPAVHPDQRSILDALGDSAAVWSAVTDVFSAQGAEVAWRHYRDGGWLAKATKKGKTVAWLSVHPGALRVAFHFAERLRPKVLGSDSLGDRLRDRIADLEPAGHLFSVPIDVRTPQDVEEVSTLLRLRLALR